MPKPDAGTSGFRKGFLLSSSNKKSSQKRRKHLENESIATSIQPVAWLAPASSTSSALMDMEDREITKMNVQSIFHVVDPSFSEMQHKKPPGLIMSHPIIRSVSRDEEDPIPTASLIDLGEDSDVLDIGLREVTTGRMQNAGESAVSTGRTSSLCVEEADDSSSQSPLSLTNMSLLEKEFARALWSLRNVSSPVQVCKQFMESYLVTSSHWRYTWKLVFQELVGEESSCAVELGYEMMILHGMSLPGSFLNIAEDKKSSRVSALGAASFFDIMARKQRCDANEKVLREMLNVIYPNLVRLAIHSSTTRSRLSQQTVAAAITIMAVSSEITAVESAFVRGLPDLDRLLAIQQQWTESSISKTENSVQVARKQCTLAVLSDWRAALNHACVNKFNRTHLGGSHVNFGGLYQTLCLESGTITVQEICAIVSETNNHVMSRDINRGLAAWLGDNKKSLKQFTLAQEGYLLVEYLIAKIWHGSVELTLTILKYIWSESNGLPPQDVSGSIFRLLLDVALKRNTSISNRDDGNISLCTLLAKLLIDGGPTRLNDFVSLAGDEPIVVEVLICVMNAGDSELVTDAAGVLISAVGNSPSLRHKMMTMPNLFQHVPCEYLIDRIIHVACTVMNEASTTSIATIDTLSTLMSQRFQQSFESMNLAHFIESIVKTLLEIEKSSENVAAELGKLFAPRWRQAIMLESVTDQRGFSLVLDALALAVLSSPSSVALLTLFGTFVGEPADYLLESTRTLHCIQLGMKHVVQLCTEHLKAVDTLELTCEVFERLSPLLLLRRIPSRLYRLAWERSFSDESTDKKETAYLLSSLASEVASRLSFDESSPKADMISPDERRLAAEVAGHCLPFDMDETCSCFHRICQPAFQKALEGACSASKTSASFKPAKAALLAVVYYLSLSVDPKSTEGIFATLAFALRICGLPESLLSEDQDLEQLRTLRTFGCAEFFSTCFEQTFVYDKSTLLNVTTWLHQILMDESPDLGRIELMATTMFHVDGKIVLSPKLRSALWNSLLDVSKRCPDGKLEKWETFILPWMIPKALDGKNHPLCVAVGLQVVFVLIVRAKSLDCVERRGGGVKKLFQGVVRSTKYPRHKDHFAVTLVKTVALKLLVAMLTMDQTGGVQYFGTTEVIQTMEILESAVVSNEEPEVRQVAAQMLSSLKV